MTADLKVGDAVAETGFAVTVANEERVLGKTDALRFRAIRHLPSGRSVEQTGATPEILAARCESWVRQQVSRKDGGALAVRPVRILTRGGAAAEPRVADVDPDAPVAA